MPASKSGPAVGCGTGCGPSNSDATTGRTGSGGTTKALTARRCLPPLGGDATGPDPTNRGKLGTKRHLLSDRRGAPLSVVLSAANRTDMKLATAVLDGLVVDRPPPTPDQPQHLYRDKGFDYPATDQAAQARGYTLHTARKRRRGDPTPPPPSDTEPPPWRWTIERTNSWHNRFRKLRIRYEKHAVNYRGLVEFACSLIVYRLCSFLG
jgi:putative transposase